MQNGAKLQEIVKENEELKNQVRVYESMRKEYLEQDATKDESQMYNDLMGQLDLLQDTTKKERLELQQAASDNAKKEKALNKYQQLIKSVIDTNLLAKSKIKKRETVISEQDEEIVDQNQEIANLNSDIEQKKIELQSGQQKMQNIQAVLNKKAADLKKAFQSQKMSEQKYKLQQAKLKQDADRQLASLRAQNQQVQAKISELDQQLGQAEQAIAMKDSQLGAAQQDLNAKEAALAAKGAALAAKNAALAAKSQEAAGLQAAVGGLKGALNAKEQEVGGLKNALGSTQGQLNNVKGQLSGTQAALAQARAEIEARKKIANQVSAALRKAGVKADVDGGTGDVTIDFGDHFFESGSAMLKPEMRKILEKALPAYARSLMTNKAVSDKISALEIVGYASPTYQGRYIDPKSTRPEDKKAIEYNLDLSYQRARSIFDYVFDPGKMTFDHQQQLRPLVKVSGKSFFDSAKQGRTVAATNTKDFCRKNDCKKFQKVLIRFNIDQK
ncbi:MAG: microtubule-binding protein [Bdellovibrionota bacterium]